jgi:DNA repair photolyase
MRWHSQTVEAERARQLSGYSELVTTRVFDAPRVRNTRFHEVHAKSALNPVSAKVEMPFGWTINPYRGYSHACHYCFARPTHEYLGLGPGDDFDREIVVKVNIADVLRAELRRPSWKHQHIALGTNTDPYQWAEGHYQLLRGIWSTLSDHANPCSVLTKSPLLLRDVDLFLELSEHTQFTAYLSVPTLEERAWRQTEPRTPSPKARLNALKQLSKRGVAVGVVIAPLLPGINDDPKQIEQIIATAEDAGAESIDALPLHLRGSTKTVFMAWLERARPELVGRYHALYGEGSEMRRDEYERLMALVRPRGRTWEERIREHRQTAAPRAAPTNSPADQQTIFD